MSGVIQFFADGLGLFILGTAILIFALIGYFVENGFRGKQILKKVTVDKPTEDIDMSEQLKDKVGSAVNQSLNQIVQNNSEVLDGMNQNQTMNQGAVNMALPLQMQEQVQEPVNQFQVQAPFQPQPTVASEPKVMSDEPVINLGGPVEVAQVQQAAVNPGVENSGVINPGTVANPGGTDNTYNQL